MSEVLETHTLDGDTSLATRAREVIRRMVLEGRFSPGQRINEADLAESLRISRGPIREAIQWLTSEGLLRSVPRRGAFVPTFDALELTHLYEVREALESAAARLAAERATDEEIGDIRRCLESAHHVAQTGAEAAYPMDLDLHGKILNASRNPRLIEMAAGLQAQIRLARSLSAHQPSRARDAYAEHCLVVEAIAARDGARAFDAMTEHLRQSLAHTARLLTAAREPGAAHSVEDRAQRRAPNK